jgi:hypothetical protein
MRKKTRLFVQKFFLISICISVVTGCGSVQHKVDFNQNYLPQADAKIEVGKVVNETGETVDIEIEKMFADALTDALREKNLLWTGNQEKKLVILAKIVEYKKGDAFKRWLLPGWGATVLSIKCDLNDENNVLVGSAQARREVSAGGAFTIGAWKTIFASIAQDADYAHTIYNYS